MNQIIIVWLVNFGNSKSKQQMIYLKEDLKGKYKVASTKWMQTRMKMHSVRDKPQGFDPKKNKFKQQWVKDYMKRHGFSVRKKKQIRKKQRFGKKFIRLKIIIGLLFTKWQMIQ